MPTIDEQLVTIARNTAAITTLIGNRFYPDTKPQGAVLPAMTYQRISTPRITTLKGTNTLAYPRFQLTVFAKNAADRAALKAAIRQTYAGYSDLAAGGFIDRILLDSEDDTYTPETSTYTSMIDLIVWHQE